MLLILVGALGTAVLVLRAGNQVAAVQVTEHVPGGERIPDGAMRQVMLPENTDIEYVQWELRGQLDKFHATTDIVSGSVLVSEMIDDGEGLSADQTVVGVSVEPSKLPAGLRKGSRVDAYFVGDSPGSSSDDGGTSAAVPGEVLAEGVKVQNTSEGEEGTVSTGTVTVNLLVDKSEAGPLIAAASENEVGLTLVSGNG